MRTFAFDCRQTDDDEVYDVYSRNHPDDSYVVVVLYGRTTFAFPFVVLFVGPSWKPG